MKRQLSFIGSIIATSLAGLHSLFILIAFFGLASWDFGMSFVFLLMYSPVIVALVFNILMIVKSKQPVETYYSKKAIVITAAVFNFVAAFMTLINFFMFGAAAWYILVGIICIAGYIVAGVFYLVEYCKVRKMFVPQNGYNQPVQAQSFAQPIQQVQPEQPVVSDLDTKLAKLNSLKEQGLITEEEYNKIKQSYIKEELGK